MAPWLRLPDGRTLVARSVRMRSQLLEGLWIRRMAGNPCAILEPIRQNDSKGRGSRGEGSVVRGGGRRIGDS